jgi:scyllo-inositol 2-dehydrogenase (NADP+)
MIRHPQTAVLVVVEESDSSLQRWLFYMQPMEHMRSRVVPRLPHDLSGFDVVVTVGAAISAVDLDLLRPFVEAGGGWLALGPLSEQPLPELFGVELGPLGPLVELRVLFARVDHVVARRLPGAILVKGRHQRLNTVSPDAEVILYADWRYERSPVVVGRSVSRGRVAIATLEDYGHPGVQQILYRLLRLLGGRPLGGPSLGVGLVGYAQWLGKFHGLALEATPGLDFRAVCDVNRERLREAERHFAQVKRYDSSQALAGDPEVDLVIIATPPNTHETLALEMIAAGKHVVCEKPLALSLREAAAMVEASEKQGVHLSCHQNRRWDADFLAIKQAVTDGLIGDLFYLETFVGGFSHPCGYWHSHQPISGGTAFDWGGHYLDGIVNLIPDRVEAVIGTRHKRVWHDITNADQERIQIRFAGGREAEFIHSDIAAVPKPKWYLLGTEGAIVGHWREVTAYGVDPILYYQEHHIPLTEMVPDLTLHRRHHSGQIVLQKLALPRREIYPFHRNLADHLLTGEPLVATLEESVQVVMILEAAARSAAKGGAVEVVGG